MFRSTGHSAVSAKESRLVSSSAKVRDRHIGQIKDRIVVQANQLRELSELWYEQHKLHPYMVSRNRVRKGNRLTAMRRICIRSIKGSFNNSRDAQGRNSPNPFGNSLRFSEYKSVINQFAI